MTVLVPGTVAGYLPYLILRPLRVPSLPQWSWSQYAAALLFAAGMLVLLGCIWEFAYVGKGTLVPFDEPRKLVVRGLYRYMRNPMYVGVLLILLAEAWFFRSPYLLAYTALWFVVFSLFVLGFEEPRLRAKYGSEYEEYCRVVGRWLPGRPRRSRR